MRWPERAAAGGRHPRLRPRGAGGAGPGPREGPRPATTCAALGGARATCRSSSRPGCSSSSTSTILDDQSAIDYADLIRRAVHRGRARTATSCARRFAPRLRRRVPGHRPRPGRAAAGARRRRPRPDRGRRPRPVDLRLPRRRRARHPRLPGARSRTPTARRRRVVALRHHPPLRPAAAARRRARSPPRIGVTGVDRRARRSRAFRRPDGRRRPSSATAGSRCCTFDTDRAETEHVADLLRRAHLEDGVALVRDGGAGPLGPHLDPGAAPVAGRRRRAGRGGQRRDAAGPRAGRAAAARRAARRGRRSTSTTPTDADYVDADRAEALLDLAARRPRRHRRPRLARRCAPREARAASRGDRRARRASCCAARVLDPALPRRRSTASRGRPRPARLAGLLARRPRPSSTAAAPPRRCSGRCGPAPTGRAGCARPSSAAGSAARLRAPRPRRDLRAVRGRRPGRGAARPHRRPRASSTPCVAQQIPADTLAERGVRGDAVRLLTAHRSKGLEWRLVVVAHVQEGGWPDLRRRGSLLQADRIGRRRPAAAGSTARDCSPRSAGCSTSPAPAPASGCVVTAVALARGRRRAAVPLPRTSSGVEPVHQVRAGPPRPLSLPGWSPSCAAPSPTPTQPERAPARRPPARLARLAGEPRSAAARSRRRPTRRRGGGPRALSRSDRAGRDRPTSRSPLSASALRGARSTCPAQWFLEREAGGERGQHDQPGLRQRRARARRAGRHAATSDAPTSTTLMALRRRGLGPAGVPHPVVARRASARRSAAALARFLRLARPARRPHGARHRGRGSTPRSTLPDGQAVAAARLRRPARARRRRPGRGRRPQDRQVPAHRQRASPSNPQLGLYQLAVDHGAVDELVGRAGRAPGAPSWSSCGSATTAAQGAGAAAAAARRPTARDRASAQLMQAAARGARRGVRRPVPATTATRCAFRADLPGQGRRDGAVVTAPDASTTRRASCAALMRRGLHVQRPAVRGDHRAARAGRRDRRRRLGQDHA